LLRRLVVKQWIAPGNQRLRARGHLGISLQ
jgi:hypothetical protein